MSNPLADRIEELKFKGDMYEECLESIRLFCKDCPLAADSTLCNTCSLHPYHA